MFDVKAVIEQRDVAGSSIPRTVKFQAWDKINKQIRPVLSLEYWYPERGVYVSELHGCKLEGDGGYDYVLAKDLDLLEYSGRKDRDMNEIYKGHILALHCLGWGETYKTNALVTMRDEEWWLYLPDEANKMHRFDRKWEKECKIIGNIYEHSELLKKEITA